MITKSPQSILITNQFPQVYRNDAPEFVAFIETYYEYLDEALNQDYFKYTDIDETSIRFLKYFEKKYLTNIELPDDATPQIIIKHITDLYKRKGSEESIRLLFKLFFDEDIELFYPSSSLLSPSNSLYYFNSYLEMQPVYSPFDYEITKGMRILGQITGASAYVEEVLFKSFEGVIKPLVFLSNVQGEFTIDDRLIALDEFGNISSFVSESIAGSISNVIFTNIDDSSPGNSIGDEFNIVVKDPSPTAPKGFYGRGMVKSIAETTSGSVKLDLIESGYGYTIPNKLATGRTGLDIDASPANVISFRYVHLNDVEPIPNATHAIKFQNDVDYYRVVSVNPVPNTSGDPLPYALSVENGLRVADEGQYVTINLTTDGTITDSTTIAAIISGDVNNDDYFYTGNLEFTVVGGEGSIEFYISDDIRTEVLETFTITLDALDSNGDPTGQPSVSFTINDTSASDGDSTTISAIRPTYNVVVSSPIKKSFIVNSSVDVYDAQLVTDLFLSNQVIEIDPTSIAKFTLSQIANEVYRIVNKLTTSSDPSDSDVEALWNFLNATNTKTEYKNADINNTGSVTEIDYNIIVNASNGDTDSIRLIGDRFDAFTKGSFNELETITYQDPNTLKVSSGRVIKYNEPLLYIQSSLYTSFPENSDDVTIEIIREDFTAFVGKNITQFNDSALFEISELGEFTETANVCVTTIDSFFNNTIDDYVNETIGSSLTFKEFQIGDIGSFRTLDSGISYSNETYAIANQPFISTFNVRSFYVVFDNIDIVLIEPDIMTQDTFDFQGNPYTARAQFDHREGDKYYFNLKSFYGFVDDFPVYIQNQSFNLSVVVNNLESDIMGNNANVVSKTSYGKGQITEVQILDTGYNYTNGAKINLVDDNGKILSSGTCEARGTGFSKGQWKTTASDLNQETRVIQDNFYYQEFSFDLGSSIPPERYNNFVQDTVQVAGTKMFSTPLINTINDVSPEITTEIAFFEIKKDPIITESETGSENPRYPEQKIVTEEGVFGILPSEELVTVEAVALTTLTI